MDIKKNFKNKIRKQKSMLNLKLLLRYGTNLSTSILYNSNNRGHSVLGYIYHLIICKKNASSCIAVNTA